MPGANDKRDRKEALRLLAASLTALVLLVLIAGAAVYYLIGLNAADPFAPGLGLKDAALISFAVSLVVILVMAVVSGGDAIFGELPFTVRGFLIFFVIFCLMVAWIF